jgi:quercetin dioxygenase-like cupin family protein
MSSPAPIKREILASVPISALPGYENRLVRLEFAPGAQGALHSHPEIGLGYIVSGEHYSQWEGGEMEYYKAGDVMIDRAADRHVHTSNPSKTENLVILLSYVIKVGSENYTAL